MERNRFLVIIFKAKSEEANECDSYKLALENIGVFSITIPPVEFQFKNLDILRKHIENPQEFSGLIVNSPRCAEAIIRSIKPESDQELLKHWRKLKCFVVGNSTARTIEKNLPLTCEGSESGNLTNLMKYISSSSYKNPFLMPVGNLHRDQESTVNAKKIEIYETIEHPLLKSSLCSVFDNNSTPLLLAFFSPSGVKFSLPYIQQYPEKSMEFVAIGTTTARELENLNLKVAGVCTKPSAEGLVEVIEKVVRVSQL